MNDAVRSGARGAATGGAVSAANNFLINYKHLGYR